MINNKYLLILLIIICWTLNPFLKKHAAKKISSNDYLVFNHILCTIIVFFYFVYLIINKKCDINCVKYLTNKDIIYSIFGALTSVLASILLIELLKKNDATEIIPNIQPLVLILTLLIGKFVFNETLTYNKIIGTIVLILGIYLFNK